MSAIPHIGSSEDVASVSGVRLLGSCLNVKYVITIHSLFIEGFWMDGEREWSDQRGLVLSE